MTAHDIRPNRYLDDAFGMEPVAHPAGTAQGASAPAPARRRPTEAEFLELGQPPIGSRPILPFRTPWRAVYTDPRGRPYHCCLHCGRAGKLSAKLTHAPGCRHRNQF